MALNKNHEVEEMDGVKCSVVEKNVLQQRVDFLTDLLTTNGYQVKIVASPPPKVAATAEPTDIPPPTTFTVGVTDLSFNSINAVFGRALKTKDGKIVTLNFWKQKETVSNDEVPYYETA